MELFQRLTTVIHSQCHSLTQSTAQTICFVSLALKSLGAGMSGYLVVVQFCDLLMIRHKDLLSSQSFPSGKQSLPVPWSSSLPQSSGKSASLPVACGAWVPSSRNLGPPPKNLITGFRKFWMGRKKSKPPNWALACWAARASVRQVTRRQFAGILISRLSWKDWDGAVWGVTRWQVWGIGPATLWSPALTSAVPGSVATLPGQLVPVIHFTLNLKYPRRIRRREKLVFHKFEV